MKLSLNIKHSLRGQANMPVFVHRTKCPKVAGIREDRAAVNGRRTAFRIFI